MHPRYSDPAIEHIWSRRRQLALWTTVEAAWMRELSPEGHAQLNQGMTPKPDQVILAEIETKHEFVAFLDVLTDSLPEDADEARRWLHFGLTSSDVIDAATALQIKATHEVLAPLVSDLLGELNSVSEVFGSEIQVGRTHGQHAQPRTLSVAIQPLFWMIHRQWGRASQAMPDALSVDFSGATGGRHHLDPRAVGRALESLGLIRAIASTQITPRDSWAHWAQCIAGLVTVCEAIAEQYWLWAQTEVAEVEVIGGAGSSAMPHKRGNPHVAENLMGLGRMARAMVAPLSESIVQRGDRDLAHSSVERVLLPDLSHLAATALTRTIGLVRTYLFNTARLRSNLGQALNDGVDSANRAAALVRDGYSRAEAINNTRKEIAP